MATPPRSPTQKKRGLGCWGCGCLILALVVLLFLGLAATGGYLVYEKVMALTSLTPATVPTFDGGDDMYKSAKQKLDDFDHDLHSHLAATIHLNADEINTLIAREPNFSKNKIRLFVNLDHSLGRVQASVPTDLLVNGIFKGRYINFDLSSEIHLDAQTRSLNFVPKHLELGGQLLLEQDSDNPDSASHLAVAFTPLLNQMFNGILRSNPDDKAFLDQAKSVEIKDGELVLETQ